MNTTLTPQFHCEQPPNRGRKPCSDVLRSAFWDPSTLYQTPSRNCLINRWSTLERPCSLARMAPKRCFSGPFCPRLGVRSEAFLELSDSLWKVNSPKFACSAFPRPSRTILAPLTAPLWPGCAPPARRYCALLRRGRCARPRSPSEWEQSSLSSPR
jgi:hypothetical protein